MDLISVIIPVYNTEKYISRCLDSIISQTYSYLDIILIDDGSSDNSYFICKMYAQRDPRIRLIHKKNSGVSATRNIGLDISKGDYIIFVDSDDFIGPEHISSLYNSLKEHNADICIGNFQKISQSYSSVDNLDTIYHSTLLDKEQTLVKMCLQDEISWEVFAKLFKRENIENIRFDVNEAIGEDFTFSYLALHNSHKICIVPSKSYYYWLREGSATQSGFSQKYLKLWHTWEKFDEFLSKNYPTLKWCSAYFKIHCSIEILDRLWYSKNANKKIEKDTLNVIKENFFSIILNSRISIKVKVKLILILINKNLYQFVKKKYSR